MRSTTFTALCLFAATIPGGAADTVKTATAPKLDPNRIINESYSFLKNREPEMTATEYALYDKVVSLISTRPDYAMKLLQTMMDDKQPPSPAFEFVLGNAFYSSSKFDLALAHYQNAVQRYPDFQRAWVNLGMTYYSMLRYPEALPCFMKALSLGDREASTYGVYAFCLAKADNVLGAEMAYTQAFTLDPENPDWIHGLVELYLTSKQYARAEALVRQLVRLRPAENRNWMLHANILLAQDRKLDAIAVLETGTRLGVVDNYGTLLLGDLYAQQGLFPEAVAIYNQVISKDPAAGTQHLLGYAQSLIAGEQLPQAQRILDSATPGDTRETRLLYLETKAALFSARKAWPEAQKSLEDILQIDALNGRALLGLGEIHNTGGNATKARLFYEQASQLPEFAYQANLELANLALAAKDYPKSLGHIRKALGIQKSPALQEYLARVSALIPDHEN